MNSLYEMMKNINALMNKGIKHLNKEDVEIIFQRSATEAMKEELEYLGCKVERVADLFNVTLPTAKFTRAELKQQKNTESFLRSIL